MNCKTYVVTCVADKPDPPQSVEKLHLVLFLSLLSFKFTAAVDFIVLKEL